MKIRALASRAGTILALCLALSAGLLSYSVPAPFAQQSRTDKDHSRRLTAAEFSDLIRELSEDDGYFHSDNFTSNETAYLYVVNRLHALKISGGAYVGVGPEQNFTYIAKLRPEIAFIVDIRRQAVIQHLLYKAVFQISENRAQFLSNLLSRPVAAKTAPGSEASVEELLEYFRSAAAPQEVYAANLSRVRSIIEQEFRFPLSDKDRQMLDYVYSMFCKAGLDISFRSGRASSGGLYGGFPTLADLIVARDQDGTRGNFLATADDFSFVRSLQLQNRIIPVVGDFAGTKALAGVGHYLQKHHYPVRAFYTSNVEQFLFQHEVFSSFIENVRKLPIEADSVIIRSVSRRGQNLAGGVPGHRNATLLQNISVLLRDFGQGKYDDYTSLVTANFVSAQTP
jgi:hypothetical protein